MSLGLENEIKFLKESLDREIKAKQALDRELQVRDRELKAIRGVEAENKGLTEALDRERKAKQGAEAENKGLKEALDHERKAKQALEIQLDEAVAARLWVAGGKAMSFSAVLTIYDVVSNSWRKHISLPSPRTECRIVWASHSLWLSGGIDDKSRLSSLHRLVDGQWVAMPGMSCQRLGHVIAAVGQHLFFIGGASDNNDVVSSCERYDTVSGRRSVMAAMSTPRINAASAVAGDCIYVFGGNTKFNDLDTIQASGERYDTVSDRWSALPAIPSPFPSSPGRTKSAAALHRRSGIIYVVGGHDGKRPLESVERFDTARVSWLSSSTPLPAAVDCHAAVCLHDSLFVLGGLIGGAAVADVWMLDVSGGGGGGRG